MRFSEDLFKTLQTFKMESLARIVNGFKPLTILAKLSIFDIWQGSKLASVSVVYFKIATNSSF